MGRIMSHINSLALINKNHHGGISKHSTTTCVLQILDDARVNLENNRKTAIMAIDLSSAYDLVDHQLLIEKSRLLGIGKTCLKWLEGFLNKRSQYVEINGTKSVVLPCGDEGVVQGGPSSGELFIIFLNSLPLESIPAVAEANKQVATSNMFVDDHTSVVSGNTEEELLKNIQQEFIRIKTYLTEHKMQINPEKTQLMFLSPTESQKNKVIPIDGASLTHQNQIRILGMNISSDLKWDYHIKHGTANMLKSINAKNALIRSVRGLIPVNALGMIANNLINSTILYGAPIWAATSQENLDLIQKSQIRAARLVINQKWQKGKKSHRQNLLNKLNWPNVRQIIQSATLKLVHRATKLNISAGIISMFKIITPRIPRGNPTYTIRHNGNCKRSANNFTAFATATFNSLPPYLRCPSLTNKKFKKAIKSYTRANWLLKQHVNEVHNQKGVKRTPKKQISRKKVNKLMLKQNQNKLKKLVLSCHELDCDSCDSKAKTTN